MRSKRQRTKRQRKAPQAPKMIQFDLDQVRGLGQLAAIGHDSAASHEVYVAVGHEALDRAANAFPNVL
jgi:hypothetical protein